MKIITLTREDLLIKDTPVDEINYFSFKEDRISHYDYISSDIVIFADKNSIKFLKLKYHQIRIVGDIRPSTPIWPVIKQFFNKWQNTFSIKP